MSQEIKQFVHTFTGVKQRIPIYEDGSVGKPENLGSFTKVQKEEDVENYKVIKESEQDDEQEKQSTMPDFAIGEKETI